MNYNDEQLLNISDYEIMAKAYSSALKSRGFMIVQIDNDEYKTTLREIFAQLFAIRALLFTLGGFLNTSRFYSLNERQIKKLTLMFDFDEKQVPSKPPRDKTKCLLSFLSTECLLIKNLIELADKTNFENQLKDIIRSRLNLLSEILHV